MSEFAKLMENLPEKEKEKKISMIDEKKNILRKLITTGYWKIIDYMAEKLGTEGKICVSELSNILGMSTGDVKYKLKILESLRIEKYRGGRPKKMYARDDFWSYDELAKLKELKFNYESPVAEKLQQKLKKLIKQIEKGKTEVNEF
jgi:predicted transcriptional regulator